ncbi:phenylacetate--CoA ligase PaaK [Pseudosulfitobacter pseudonitzschiae]|uniref:phenylacetate--CoA ligase PaaK n=1 Tax=Pseudosulfitobacter pseudonitzschiae TaxID=1402135 RepID=UPI001AF69C49|nr:phenylacetate--CoA ligase PaaK [Pseudosulfitobacter pseudonitzschiae]MBM1815773.1 phenylacetate--CoA ligase [Pseudosulfitobacter pseudonitzschiae]MBM1832764.1 phenylacetate--CoA ligase [Pseudosulfitobacter pseudonitzschiae]MBM1837632.1 phenylacetate--CoA ligase [Pseudosulfitobacter pseudonitzschiae]MBM1842478.1 phenylacetate--CoA ligase [Pseudosulfitobacter pseudonitzschiae]MBM1847346.1 phenylacetate--CoA ligase [Pseudosulfitobacter pseudonitzschiae]
MKDLTPDKASLDPIELASRDEISALQLERLKWSLNHAYTNVPHYKKAFDAAGVHPDDLHSLSDLSKFPFTVKQDLRDNYPFGMFAVPREQVSRIHASSGTTGQPTVVGYTRNDLDVWGSVVARSLRASGLRPGDLLHNAYGYGLFTGGLGIHLGADKLGLSTVPISGGMTPRQVRLIEDFKPDGITVTPSYALSILDEFNAQGLDPRDCSMKVGIFGAEPWTNAMRREIEDAFDMHAVDIYGLSEIMGPGVANECVETKDGLHIWEDHFYPEVINPETGELVADGEQGELVFTSLTKEAFPIIRYRTRDLTRLLPGTARSMRRMEKITGRSDDMIILRGVNVFPTQIEECLMATAGLAPHFQIELTKPGRMDQLCVLAEVADASVLGDARDAAAKALSDRIKQIIGISVKVQVSDVGGVARSEGKAARIIDKR